ncbi:MAG: hypothetical protein Kow0069_29450 [Promethearchaeota archaeon]
MAFVGDAIASPGKLGNLVGDTDELPRPRAYAVVVPGFAFATHVAAAYSGKLFQLAADHPLAPYEGWLNLVALFVVGLLLFATWWVVDAAGASLTWRAVRRRFDVAGGGRSSAGLAVALRASFAPLLPLVAAWAFLRGVYHGTYLAWGLPWLPYFTVGVTMAWHYGLLGYLVGKLAAGEATTRPAAAGAVAAACVVALGVLAVAGVAAFFELLPPLFRATPGEFIGQVF